MRDRERVGQGDPGEETGIFAPARHRVGLNRVVDPEHARAANVGHQRRQRGPPAPGADDGDARWSVLDPSHWPTSVGVDGRLAPPADLLGIRGPPR